MRLIDLALEGLATTAMHRVPAYVEAHDALQAGLVAGSEWVFVGDQVTEFYLTDPRQTDPMTFPSLAPPAATFWVETQAPEDLTVLSGERWPAASLPYRWGALFRLIGPQDTWGMHWQVGTHPLPAATRWVLQADLVVQLHAGGPASGPVLSMILVLDDDGRLLQARPFSWARLVGQEDQDWWQMITEPLLFTLCLLNMRNVPQQVVEPTMTKRQRLGKERPMVRYTTLDVRPMREAVQAVRASGGVSVERALHLCRGHKKDFRENGLFGRHKGIYYWGPQVRGEASAGVVIKDYDVHPE